MLKPKPIKKKADAAAVALDYDPTVFSRSDIAINRALDLAVAWLDHYIVTPLLGKNGAASASPEAFRYCAIIPLARGRV